MKRTRVLIADDTEIRREGLTRILEGFEDIDIVGTVLIAQQIIKRAIELNVHSIIMGMSWYGDNIVGKKIIRYLKKHFPGIWIIVVVDEFSLGTDASKLGSDVVLPIHLSKREIIESIRAHKSQKIELNIYSYENYHSWEVDALISEIFSHKENLHTLELQRAFYGPLDVPLKITNGIRETQRQIKFLETNLDRIMNNSLNQAEEGIEYEY